MYDLRQFQKLIAPISDEVGRNNLYPFLAQEVLHLLENNQFELAIARMESAIATETLLDKPAGQIADLQTILNKIIKIKK
jgi:hypothetical protein